MAYHLLSIGKSHLTQPPSQGCSSERHENILYQCKRQACTAVPSRSPAELEREQSQTGRHHTPAGQHPLSMTQRCRITCGFAAGGLHKSAAERAEPTLPAPALQCSAPATRPLPRWLKNFPMTLQEQLSFSYTCKLRLCPSSTDGPQPEA